MYTSLGFDFHIGAIDEMLHICKEIRITPIVDLDGKSSELTERVIRHYDKKHDVSVENTSYESLKNENQLLKICKK